MNVNIVTMNQYTQFLGTLGVIASHFCGIGA